MRSPMTQNGCSLPMTTVLDRDWMTVSTRLSLLTGRDAEPAAQTRDAGLAAEADQVQAAHTGLRERVRGELDTELEARLLGIVRALAALDQLVRNRDPRNLLVDEAQRGRRADEADRGQQRALGREARAHALGEEPLQPLALEADLQLQEARAGAHLLPRTLDTVLVRRCGPPPSPPRARGGAGAGCRRVPRRPGGGGAARAGAHGRRGSARQRACAR